MTPKNTSNTFIRNRGGYTSIVADMSVQWDFKMNCGLRGRRWFPVAALIPAQSDEPWPEEGFIPDDVQFRTVPYRARKCAHHWLIGDYLSVCSKCSTEIPHGMSVPAFGEARSEFKAVWCTLENPDDPSAYGHEIVNDVKDFKKRFSGLHEYDVRFQICELLCEFLLTENYGVRVVVGKAGIAKHCWLEFHTEMILDPCSGVFKRPTHGNMPSVYIGKKLGWYWETPPMT